MSLKALGISAAMLSSGDSREEQTPGAERDGTAGDIGA